MFFRRRFWTSTIALAFSLTVLACSSSDDDDGGDDGSGGSGGGGGEITVSSNDIGSLGQAFSTNFQVNGLIFTQIPFGPSPDADIQTDLSCLDSQSNRDGADFDLTITMDGCDFGEPPIQIFIDGFFMVEGSLEPDESDIAQIVEDCRPYIDDIDTVIELLGAINFYMRSEYDYTSEASNNASTVTENGLDLVSVFEDGVLMASRYDMTFSLDDGKSVTSGTTFHLAFVNAESEEFVSPIGQIIYELADEGTDDIQRTVKFFFDGSKIATFEIEETDENGEIDLETGEVTFDT